MTSRFLEAPGAVADLSALAGKAHALAARLQRADLPYASLLECRKHGQLDIVVLEVEVEVGQAPANDVRRFERLAVIFDPEDRTTPRVLALRADFPLVPHLNVEAQALPRSLCLFEQAYSEVKLNWTATGFVSRIRDWMRLTARGELHAPDQTLEQFLLNKAGTLILPSDFVSKAVESGQAGFTGALQPLNVVSTPLPGLMLIAERAEPGSAATPAEPNTVAATFVCQPREHGVIEHTPATLAELHSLLADGGDNLLGGLRDHLRGWKETAPLGAKVAIVVIIPLRRTATGPIERHEAWAFLSAVTLKEIGVAVGIWVVQDQHVGLLMPRDETQRGESVPLALVDVVSKLSRATAAALNGYLPAADLNVVAIGCGALGSQIILNAARGSFGRWTLVDKDHLLPHNLARHALTNGVGLPKAVGLSFWVDGIVDDAPAPQAIVADVLNPGDTAATLDAVLSEAHLVLDMSTSIPVARHLTLDVTCPGRRASVFLNPQGTDLVLLIEDADRRVALDSLEMQYYRSILERPELLGHLANPQGRLRYGRTCRDVTFTLPQELVGLHAGIACGALRRAMDSPTARIVIWQADQLQGSVVPVSVEPNHARRVVVDDWTVVTDDGFLSKLMDCRRARLPNETGGVLLGALDLQRKIVYVVDALPSPADSEEYPTHYIRGSQGLRTQVEESARKTGDQLQYVGEWHSHPDGYGATPSGDDAQVLAWVRDDLERDGLPAVMLIASEGGRVAVFVSAMTPGHWPPHVLHAAGS